MSKHTRLAFPLAAMAAALLSVYGPALAQDSDEMKQLTSPDSSVRIGAGYLSDDAPLFGRYTGVRDEGGYGLLDVDIVRRNDATGTWFKAQGRNLGLDSRDLRISHDRQGDWGYYLDYSELPRYEPLTVITNVTGIGTNLQINNVATPLSELRLKTKREALGLGFNKKLGGGFNVELRARSEDKDGSRLWGGNSNQFLAEPINSTTRQYDAIVGYSGERLQLSGGYYGSSYSNQNVSVNINTINAGNAISLPPDNESHQLYLSGAYAFAPSTKGTFKVSTTRATQNDTFHTPATFVSLLPGASAAGRTDLDGKVDTTLVQMGVTSRPMPKLSLLANLRYEDRDDKTPRFQYASGTAGRDGFNTPMSRRLLTGKAEASYQLPAAFRLTGGVDVENIKRSVTPTLRHNSWREKNDEISYRLGLSRSMSETLNGSVSYIHSDRDGSDYLEANNNPAPDVIDPIHWADRKRDKVKLSVDWAPAEAVSLQFSLHESRDKYDGRPLGPERGKARLYSIDASYSFSDAWQATAWVSRDENRMTQSTITAASQAAFPLGVVAGPWQARLSSVGNAVGLGMRGKPSARMQVGAELQYGRDTDKFGMTQLAPTVGSLPDINNKSTTLKLFGTYALQKNSSVRLDYVHDRRTSDDWTWTSRIYSPVGTTVILDPNQKTNFIGVSYIYKFL